MLNRRSLFARAAAALGAVALAPLARLLPKDDKKSKSLTFTEARQRIADGYGTYYYSYTEYNASDLGLPEVQLSRPFSVVDGRIYTTGICQGPEGYRITFSKPHGLEWEPEA